MIRRCFSGVLYRERSTLRGVVRNKIIHVRERLRIESKLGCISERIGVARPAGR